MKIVVVLFLTVVLCHSLRVDDVENHEFFGSLFKKKKQNKATPQQQGGSYGYGSNNNSMRPNSGNSRYPRNGGYSGNGGNSGYSRNSSRGRGRRGGSSGVMVNGKPYKYTGPFQLTCYNSRNQVFRKDTCRDANSCGKLLNNYRNCKGRVGKRNLRR